MALQVENPDADGAGGPPLDVAQNVEDLEIQLLLDGILHRYGYDFRNYAPASLRRRSLGYLVMNSSW